MKHEASSTYDVPPRDWVRILARYRDPSTLRSWCELVITLGPFIGLGALALWLVPTLPVVSLLLSVLNAGFLLRMFIIQHDCGHGSFFASRRLNDWVGRVFGIFTLTPYDVWRRTHAIHHSHSGDLDRRGIGDVLTLTTEEYAARRPLERLMYRTYRHPLVMFGLGPGYLFMLQNRLPLGLMGQGRRYWISAMATNLAIALIVAAVIATTGLAGLLLVVLPTTLVAASIGVWLFYVQHQFEDTHWNHTPDWQLHEAALHGSSHYDLPPVLRWFSGNIGIHHVHHLYSRIPFYRLPDVLRDHPILAEHCRMTLRQSLSCAHLDLWDHKRRRLVSFATARANAA
ncbi:fatty acid desaturase [Oceanibium sediminis]|uniref:fatty acid desaturase n=1 Tax=Oceanibium sediminis TaxID=2026339 RepID=UPI000DD36073|nr:fatty acid desaturase [Oceanibium sediminis]